MVGQTTLANYVLPCDFRLYVPNYLLYEAMGQLGTSMPVMHIVVGAQSMGWALLGLAITLKCPPLKKLFQIEKLNPLPESV